MRIAWAMATPLCRSESVSVAGPGVTRPIAQCEALRFPADRAELDRDAHVERWDSLTADQIEQPLRFLVGHREIDRDREIAGQLEKMLFVKNAVAPKAGDGAKRRAAVDAQLFRLLEQPFVEQDVIVLAILVDVKAKQSPFHGEP